MPKLVSVIIPCFNAEKWLAEAIDSCLKQTYPQIEIIVINDGSTDNSLEILKSYGNQIILHTSPNCGGNHARNLGFALSKGEYIQYLDADDYILPEKIARQVSFLEATEADVVYGDWRHQYHLPDGTSFLDQVEIAGSQTDILESLLANWWTAVASLLYRRSAVEKTGGWDENLAAAQDRDFFISVVMSGAKVLYQPGCYAIYRKHGDVTVSTSSKIRWIKCHDIVLQKAQNQLCQLNKFTSNYRYALAESYFELARESWCIDYSLYEKFLEKTCTLVPDFQHHSQRAIYNILQRFIGFRKAESITCRIFWIKNRIQSVYDHLMAIKVKLQLVQHE